MRTPSDLIRKAAEPLIGSSSDYDSLLDLAGDARFVLQKQGRKRCGGHDSRGRWLWELGEAT